MPQVAQKNVLLLRFFDIEFGLPMWRETGRGWFESKAHNTAFNLVEII